MRLVLRLLIKRRLQADQVLSKTAFDNYQVCEALPTHMSETGEDRLVMYAQMAGLVQQILSPDEVNVKEVTEIICRFACNAHTICDEEMRPLGTGFYPVVSIINHSCLPNAVLHFDGSRAAVRAIDDINEGAEESSAGLREDAFLEGYKCINLNCDGPLIAEPGCVKISCETCGCKRDEQEAKSVAREVELKELKASELYSSGSIPT